MHPSFSTSVCVHGLVGSGNPKLVDVVVQIKSFLSVRSPREVVMRIVGPRGDSRIAQLGKLCNSSRSSGMTTFVSLSFWSVVDGFNINTLG